MAHYSTQTHLILGGARMIFQMPTTESRKAGGLGWGLYKYNFSHDWAHFIQQGLRRNFLSRYSICSALNSVQPKGDIGTVP